MEIVTHVLTSEQNLDETRQKIARNNIKAVSGAKVKGEVDPLPVDEDGIIEIPSGTVVGEGFLTITDGNEVLGQFGANQATDTTIVIDTSGKADKVLGDTAGHLAGLDENGNLTDSGKGPADFATAAQGALAETAYQKPNDGIPKVDLDQSVQDSLDKADTALQADDIVGKEDKSNKVSTWSGTPDDEHYPTEKLVKDSLDQIDTDVSGKADKVSGATNGHFAGLDGNGDLTDSGKGPADFATAAQGALADSAYQKPNAGIPKADLDQAVQDSLDKADTALQEHQDISGKEDKSNKVAAWSGTPDNEHYPTEKLVKDSLDQIDADLDDKADKVTGATNGHFAGLDGNGNLTDSGKGPTDFATAAQGAKADTAYQKPNDGIPKADLDPSVQDSLDKADTALQEHQDISGKEDKSNKVATWSGTPDNEHYPTEKLVKDSLDQIDTDLTSKADKVDNATAGNFAGLDANGNLTDSGSKATDFATAAQGAKADSAIQGVKVNGTLLIKDEDNVVNAQIESIVQPQTNGEWIWSDEKGASNSMGWRQIIRDYVGNIQRDDNTGEPVLDEEGHPITDAEDAADAVELWLRYKGIEFAARRAYDDETGENIHTAIHNRTTMAQVVEAIETALANYGGFKVVPLVNDVPDPSPDLPSEKFIYLTKEDPSAKTDPYTEWIWIAGTPDGHWDCIGETSIDLTGYWHGAITTNGSGNVVTDVSVDLNSGAVTVTKYTSVADGATKVEASTTNGNILIDGVETKVYEHPVPSTLYPQYDKALYKVAIDSTGHVLTTGTKYPTAADASDIIGLGIFNDLDADVTSSDGTNVQVNVTETNGVITAVSITTDNTLNASDIAGKADKVSGATNGNFAGLDANGNLTDSGSKASDFATAAQGLKADSAVQGVQKNGTDITLDANKKANVVVNDADFKVKLGSGSATTVFSADADTDSTLDIPLAAADSSGATTEYTEGLMTGEDKEKLDGITDYVVSASVSDRTLTLTNKNGPATTFTDTGDTNVIESISVNSVPLIPDANKNVDVTVPAAANDATITIEVGGAASGETAPVAGDFSTDQDAAETITIPAAVSATQNDPAQPGVMSSADKEKLDGIEAGAEVNEVETISIGGGTPITPTVNTTNIDIPMAGYDDTSTPTVYTSGAMSGEDKEKLDTLKNFSKVTISDGAVTPTTEDCVPSSEDDTLTLVSGTNITLTKAQNANTVTIEAAGGTTVSSGRGISIIESPTATGTDYNVSVDASVGYYGSVYTINNVQTVPVDVISANSVPTVDSGNDRFVVAARDGVTYLYALKTVKDVSHPENDVAGVDVFTLNYNALIVRTPAHGFYGMAGIQLIRDSSVVAVLHASSESYPSSVGECSINGSTVVWNNAGTPTTINEKEYYGYRLIYVGDASLGAGDTLRITTRFSVLENMAGTAEYTGTINSYQGGDGIVIDQNNIVSVNPGDGLVVDTSDNTLKINVKQGGGLAFEQDGQLMAIALDQVTEEVVDTVKEISSDMESKLTTNFPYPMITEVSYDFGSLNVNGSCICQLFSVPFRHPIIAGETYVTVYAKDNGYSQTNVMFGIYEYDPAGNNGTGDTRFVCDTGAVSLYKAQTNSVLEFPITHVDPDHNALYPNCMYYAVLALPPNAGSGIFLAAAPNYNAPVNSMPTLNWRITNCNLIDWDHPADASINKPQVPWSQSGYNEHNSMYRFFMQIRNHTQQNNSGN